MRPPPPGRPASNRPGPAPRRGTPRARCGVVAEHVEAGARGRHQHGVAGMGRAVRSPGPTARAIESSVQQGDTRRAPARPGSAARSRPISTTASGWRAHRRGQRSEILALVLAAEDDHQLAALARPGRFSAATVAPTLVPLLSSKYSTSWMVATGSTRCGSPLYSRRPYSTGAEWATSRHGQRQAGECVDRVVPAADAQRIGRHQALDVQVSSAASPALALVVSSASMARASQMMPLTTSRPKSPGPLRHVGAEAST